MTDKQKQNTVNFLKDNELYLNISKALGNIEDEESKNATLRMDSPVDIHPFEPNVQTGDIRMFSQTDVLTYCVVLPWDEMHYLVVPFSHRSFPATDEEMFAEHHEENADYCKVLQIWNARTVCAPVMQNTWKMGQVSPDEICRIKKLLGYLWLDDAIPDELADLTGLPIRNDADPRVPYKSEELDHFSELDAQDIAFESVIHSFDCEDDEAVSPAWLISFPAEPVLAAAAGEEQLSEVFLKNGEKIDFVTGMELLNFEPVSEGEELPSFIWSDESSDPLKSLYGHPVLFLKRGTKQILGSGIVEKDGIYCTIHLRNPVKAEDVPAIENPGDIILFIL